ncbi:MAG TPA: hypothetical protein DG084_09795, partial [Gemmatimonadetes bacterium]|nr:hypothetical protein [Gemmatimonadota bacterium]
MKTFRAVLVLTPHLGTGAELGSNRIPAGGEPAKGVVQPVGTRKRDATCLSWGLLSRSLPRRTQILRGKQATMDKWTPPGNENGQIGPGVSEDNDELWIEPRMD